MAKSLTGGEKHIAVMVKAKRMRQAVGKILNREAKAHRQTWTMVGGSGGFPIIWLKRILFNLVASTIRPPKGRDRVVALVASHGAHFHGARLARTLQSSCMSCLVSTVQRKMEQLVHQQSNWSALATRQARTGSTARTMERIPTHLF